MSKKSHECGGDVLKALLWYLVNRGEHFWLRFYRLFVLIFRVLLALLCYRTRYAGISLA